MLMERYNEFSISNFLYFHSNENFTYETCNETKFINRSQNKTEKSIEQLCDIVIVLNVLKYL